MIQKHQRIVRSLCLSAAIAAVYAVLTLSLPVLSYGPVQLRLAEALTVLAWFCPEAIPGLTLGCFLSNLLGSPYVLDWVFGTGHHFWRPFGPPGCPSAGWRPSRLWSAIW